MADKKNSMKAGRGTTATKTTQTAKTSKAEKPTSTFGSKKKPTK